MKMSGPNYGFLAQPPPVQRTVARGFVCCAIALRADLEPAIGSPAPGLDVDSVLQLLELTRRWLEHSGFDAELDDAERGLLDSLPGARHSGLLEPFAQHKEALGVIAWVLRAAPLVSIDEDVDAGSIAAAMGWLTDDGATLHTRARPRTREQLAAYLDAIAATHWRISEHVRQPASIGMTRWGAAAGVWPEETAPIALAAGGDLALAGEDIDKAGPSTLLAALQRVQGRHRATLWLLGQHRDFRSVTFPE